MIVGAIIGVTRKKSQIKASFVGQGIGSICVGACFQQMRETRYERNILQLCARALKRRWIVFVASRRRRCSRLWGRRGPHFLTPALPVILSRTFMHQAQVLRCRDFRS